MVNIRKSFIFLYTSNEKFGKPKKNKNKTSVAYKKKNQEKYNKRHV